MASLCQQTAALWPADQRPTACAVCMAESGGDPNARCLNCAGVVEDSRGLWQINVATGANPQYAGWDLYDPATNARAALALSRNGDDWSDWSTYRGGTYQAYLAACGGSGSGGSGATSPTAPRLAPIAVAAFLLYAFAEAL